MILRAYYAERRWYRLSGVSLRKRATSYPASPARRVLVIGCMCGFAGIDRSVSIQIQTREHSGEMGRALVGGETMYDGVSWKSPLG